MSKSVNLFHKLQKQYWSTKIWLILLHITANIVKYQIKFEKFTNLPVCRFIFFIFFSLDNDLCSELNLNLKPDNRLKV